MALYTVVFIFLFSSFLRAGNIANICNIYLVYPASFTQANFDTIKNYQDSLDSKMVRNTQLLPAANTNYYILEITTKTSAQNTAINAALSSGKIIKIAERIYYSYFDGNAGRTVSFIRDNWIIRPKEITDAYKVEVDTP